MLSVTASSRVAMLLAAGTLRQHAGRGAVPGERGSGYSAATFRDHMEPSEIYVLGT